MLFQSYLYLIMKDITSSYDIIGVNYSHIKNKNKGYNLIFKTWIVFVFFLFIKKNQMRGIKYYILRPLFKE